MTASCSTAPQAYTTAERTIDMGAYKTFAWLPRQPLEAEQARGSAYELLYDNDITERNIKDRVNAVLISKGMEINVNDPDALFQYHIVIEKREQLINTPIVANPPNILMPDPGFIGTFTNTVYNRLTNDYTVYPYTYHFQQGINIYNTTPHGFTYGNPYVPYVIGNYFEKIDFSEGTLIIDMIDRKTNKLVWRGWSKEAITEPGDFEKHLTPKITAIMELFRGPENM